MVRTGNSQGPERAPPEARFLPPLFCVPVGSGREDLSAVPLGSCPTLWSALHLCTFLSSAYTQGLLKGKETRAGGLAQSSSQQSLAKRICGNKIHLLFGYLRHPDGVAGGEGAMAEEGGERERPGDKKKEKGF